jgi:hypothetical protein
MNMLRTFVAVVAAVASTVPALSAQFLEVEVDKSRMLTLNGQPGAIVIGNPSIADVTTHGDKIFIHGRNFGETSLTILDLDGNTIMDFNLVTRRVADTAVAVYKGNSLTAARRFSYTCYPLCESDLQVGDDIFYFKGLIEEASNKMEFATGSETSEAKAPQAPQ